DLRVILEHVHIPKELCGRIDRIMRYSLESALIDGLLYIGAELMRLGLIPTPGVAYLTRPTSSQAGIMIPASHNPVEDNGIKFFGPDGLKLLDELEEEIKQQLD